MSKRKYQQILDVVENHPVTDPRGAMIAIAEIAHSESLAPKKQKPVLSINVFDHGDDLEVSLKHVEGIDPSAALAAKEAIAQFGQDTFGSAIRDADTDEIIGFEKFGPHKGITQTDGPDCDCPACRLKRVLLEIKAKIDAKRSQIGELPLQGNTELPKGAVAQTEIDGCTATAFTNVDDLMAHIEAKVAAEVKATDSGSTQGAN